MDRLPRVGDIIEDFSGVRGRTAGRCLVLSVIERVFQRAEFKLLHLPTNTVITRYIAHFETWAWELSAEVDDVA